MTALLDRKHLFDYNEELIRVALGRASAIPERHAVILADTRDPVGGAIAESAADHSAHKVDVAAERERIVASARIPTAIIVVDREILSRCLKPFSPKVAERLLFSPPAGMFFVAVVAGGGTSLVLMGGGPTALSGSA